MDHLEEDSSWSAQEFSDIHLGDARLKARFIKTVMLFSQQPQASINQACGSWKNTKAAYRMLDNNKLLSTEVNRTHLKQVLLRANLAPVVLAIQDTTSINYSNHSSTEGLGHIGVSHSKNIQGLMMHTTLGVTAEGLPIGILRQDIWARDQKPKYPSKNGKRDRSFKNLPIEDKESAKWVRSLECLNSLKSEFKGKWVSIGDRESDVYEYIQRANALEISFVIRAVRDRVVVNTEVESLLWEHMIKVIPQREINDIKVPEKKGVTARVAQVSIRFSEVTLRPPLHRPSVTKCPPEKVFAILVREENPPVDGDRLEWMLLCNEKVEKLEDALEKINWYKQRWHIESFHKVLKSGCAVESCRLDDAEKLNRYLTIFSIIACRLYWITHVGRSAPSQPCTVVLKEYEWQVLDCTIHQTSTPRQTPPSLYEAIRWIAQLGGFLARKGDGEPGIISIWRGWQRLHDLSQTWLLIKGK